MAQSASRRSPSIKKADPTLYCSFCGKSQHEVQKLVAGPTVFICDECVELCDDIVWLESGARIAIKVQIPPNTAYDDVFYEAVANIVRENFPGNDFRYEFKTPSRERDGSKLDVVAFTIKQQEGVEHSGHAALKAQITQLANKLAIMTTKFAHENERARALAEEIKNVKLEYLDYVRANLKREEPPSKDIRSVMFLDISGFSKFSFESKQEVVDMLRGITPPLLGDRGANQINMWGDAIVANFVDPTTAINCAAKFLRHLSVEQLDARIGMAWGEVRLTFNEATGRRDVDGPVVDFAARLEPMAPLGGILLSKEYLDLDLGKIPGEIVSTTKPILKAFANFNEGDDLEVCELRLLRN